MARPTYHIPTTLDVSQGEMTIVLRTKSGMSSKPVTINLVISVLGSLLALLYMVLKTPLASMPVIMIIAYVAAWVGLTFLLAVRLPNGEAQIRLVSVLTQYLPPSMRHVRVRRGNVPSQLMRVTGIREVDADGVLTFTDGSFGCFYRVVGSASVLLFDQDRDAILDRVDRFYRKMIPEVQIGFVTVKESQVVREQLDYHARLDSALSDPQLRQLNAARYMRLYTVVGETYKSVHQYLYLRARTLEQLHQGVQHVLAEAEGSTLMFKQLEALDGEDVCHVLRSVYSS